MLARAEVVGAQTRRGVSPRGVCRPCAARARASTVAASRGGLAVLELGLERGLRLKGLRRGLRASAAASSDAAMLEVMLPHTLEKRLPSDTAGAAERAPRPPLRPPPLAPPPRGVLLGSAPP